MKTFGINRMNFFPFISTFSKNLCNQSLHLSQWKCYLSTSHLNVSTPESNFVSVGNRTFEKDKWTNVTPHVLKHLGANLHLEKHHPLSYARQRIVRYMYGRYLNRQRSPIFSVYDRLDPVVNLKQNFDSLLIPLEHPSRKLSDNYYINEHYCLRSHTSAHQSDLIRSGLDNFLVIGDCYRRDQVDCTHYPVFHQAEGVRIVTKHELFIKQNDPDALSLFENGERTPGKQSIHTLEAVKLMEHDLKSCLVGLAENFFGRGIPHRWVNAYFPFTHPSWELEVQYKDEWLEVCGCGIMEQAILEAAGVGDRIGWAFGIGLERIAMKQYDIPDIRLFWSKDTGFTSQFKVPNPFQKIKYKPVSAFPQCINDISFWTPEGFNSNDFHDLVRSIGGDLVEQVSLFDQFIHPKTQRTSHSYRIVYRHMEKVLTKEEANAIHKEVEERAKKELKVQIR